MGLYDELKHLSLTWGELWVAGEIGYFRHTEEPVNQTRQNRARRPYRAGGHHVDSLAYDLWACGQPKVGPGAGNDGAHDQFVVAFGSNHNQPDVGPRQSNGLK